MKTNIDSLKPKHGEKLNIDCNKAKVRDALAKIIVNQNEAVKYLFLLCAAIESNKLIIPCKQCFLDIASQFEEIGSLIRELADD